MEVLRVAFVECVNEKEKPGIQAGHQAEKHAPKFIVSPCPLIVA